MHVLCDSITLTRADKLPCPVKPSAARARLRSTGKAEWADIIGEAAGMEVVKGTGKATGEPKGCKARGRAG